MLHDAESDLYGAIGAFSTVAQVAITGFANGYISDSYGTTYYGDIAGQCAAFLTSNHAFTLFIESWDITRENGNPTFQNKKIYPAKVTGLSIPYPQAQTFRWKEGLIYNSFYLHHQDELNYRYFRPGFGEQILSDYDRPFTSVSVVENRLGLGAVAQLRNYVFASPLGRLMSAAFYVDPIEAEKYDKSQNKKKKKSLNEQDYQQIPEYPPYTPYQDNSGY